MLHLYTIETNKQLKTMKNTMTTAEKARKDFNEKGILPPHLKALAVLMGKNGFSKKFNYKIKDVTPKGYAPC